MDKYVLIVESKREEPLVSEQYLYSADYEAIYNRMLYLEERDNVIRVCMAKLVYECGNSSLLARELKQ